MQRTEPYCTVEYVNQNYHYRVYDYTGSMMVYTTNRTVADQFLQLAQQGISARVYYWLERWNYRVPKQYLNLS